MKFLKKFGQRAALALGLATAVLLPFQSAQAFVYSTTVKSARMTAVRDTWGSAAVLKIYTSAYGTLLCTFTLSATTADSTVSSGVLTLKFTGNSASQTVTAAATGTAAIAKIQTSGATDVVNDFTVGTSGSNINLNTTSIVSGANCSITAATMTHG